MSLTKPFTYGLYIFISFILVSCGGQVEPEKREIGSVHVDTLIISPSTLRLSKELPGRIAAFKKAEVRPQVTGILKSRLYKEGSQVEAGDVLYQIDPTTYQSAVNSAKAQLTKALANEYSTKKTFIRNTELLNQKLTSQQIVDDAESAYQQAQADVAIRQAELNNANVQLSYTKIKAPISGQVGISQVSEGSLLTAEQSSYLTTIIQTSDVYIDMQQSSVSLYKLKQEFKRPSKPTEMPNIPVSITLEDGTAYDEIGHLEFADTQVTGSTGTLTLRAIIPNPSNTLLAGMYVRAHISMPEEREYIVLPQSLVVRSQSGEPSVYTVDQNNIVVKQSVVLGDEVNNGWIIKEGLTAGDQVVINNLNKVKNNQQVIVDNNKESSPLSTEKNQSHNQTQD